MIFSSSIGTGCREKKDGGRICCVVFGDVENWFDIYKYYVSAVLFFLCRYLELSFYLYMEKIRLGVIGPGM